MKIICESNPKYYAINLDLSLTDLKESKKRKSHNEYVLGDGRNLPFREKSFGVALVSNILEHLSKTEGTALLKNIETIATKQITVAVPCDQGLYSSPDAENPYQAHVSTWSTSDFLDLGYKTRRFGAPWFRGEPIACLISNKLKLTGSASSKRIYTITFVFLIDDFYDVIGGLLAYPFNKGSVLVAKKVFNQ